MLQPAFMIKTSEFGSRYFLNTSFILTVISITLHINSGFYLKKSRAGTSTDAPRYGVAIFIFQFKYLFK